MSLLSSAISAFVQLDPFLVIPFVWWAFTARHSAGSASWIGLRRPIWSGRRARLGVATLARVVTGATLTALLQFLSGGVPTARFAGRGLDDLVPVLFFTIVQTSFIKGLFFRGFLGKRVIARWGFAPGNAAQAIAFGIPHVTVLVSFADPIWLLAIGTLTGADGWIIGWLSEEGTGRSTLPGQALRASASLFVGTTVAFNLMG